MAIYVWNDVLCNFDCGYVIAYAESEEAARNIIIEQYKEYLGDPLGNFNKLLLGSLTRGISGPANEVIIQPRAFFCEGYDG